MIAWHAAVTKYVLHIHARADLRIYGSRLSRATYVHKAPDRVLPAVIVTLEPCKLGLHAGLGQLVEEAAKRRMNGGLS